ncbi:hypothetical protein RyT2_01940 [Pseudolactococcus yaeyamensis]
MTSIDFLQNEDFFGFCLVIENQAYKTSHYIKSKYKHNLNYDIYKTSGKLRQEYLKDYKDIIDNKEWKHSNLQNILKIIIENETKIAFN